MSKDSKAIKEIVFNLGADICGISSVDRFDKAPKGFHPIDIYESCKSVVVFAKKVPPETLFAKNCVPYTFANNILMQEVDGLTIKICLALSELGIGAVPVPSDEPYEHWEAARSYGRAILSLRHAGHLAGLGVLGNNTLLINKDYGNMIKLAAVLVDMKLETDQILSDEGCIKDCKLCIESCPQKALDGETVNQQLCRPLSNYVTEKGYRLIKCNLCRRVCPKALGETQC